MKNPIIAELRRIRDARAKTYGYDIQAMARDLAQLEPWMKKKTYVLRRGRMTAVASLREGSFQVRTTRLPSRGKANRSGGL